MLKAIFSFICFCFVCQLAYAHDEEIRFEALDQKEATLREVAATSPDAIRIKALFAQLQAAVGPAAHPVTLKVVVSDSNILGGQAMPSGVLAVNVDIAKEQDATVMFILGHEYAHIQFQHIAGYLRFLNNEAKKGPWTDDSISAAMQHVGHLSREGEHDADAFAAKVTASFHFPVKPVVAFMAANFEGDSLTHPATAERIKRIKAIFANN